MNIPENKLQRIIDDRLQGMAIHLLAAKYKYPYGTVRRYLKDHCLTRGRIKVTMSNAWTQKEDQMLVKLINSDFYLMEIETILKRSQAAIRSRAWTLRTKGYSIKHIKYYSKIRRKVNEDNSRKINFMA